MVIAILPVCLACAMNRNASAAFSSVNAHTGSGRHSPRSIAPAISLQQFAAEHRLAFEQLAEEDDVIRHVRRRAITCSRVQTPGLPISRNRPPVRAGRCWHTNSPASELSTTSTPAPAVSAMISVGEGQRPRVVDVPDAERPQVVPLAPPPAVAYTSAPMPWAICDRREAHPAGAGVDQHPFTGVGARRAGAARCRRSWWRSAVAAGVGERHRLGRGATNVASHVTWLPNAPGARATTWSPTREVDTAAHGDDRAGAFPAQRAGVAGIHPEHVEHVPEVQARGGDFDLDFTGELGARRRAAATPAASERATAVDFETKRCRAIDA